MRIYLAARHIYPLKHKRLDMMPKLMLTKTKRTCSNNNHKKYEQKCKILRVSYNGCGCAMAIKGMPSQTTSIFVHITVCRQSNRTQKVKAFLHVAFCFSSNHTNAYTHYVYIDILFFIISFGFFHSTTFLYLHSVLMCSFLPTQ